MRRNGTLVQAVSLLEAIYATTCVNKLLLACEERMALGTDIHSHLFFYRTCNEFSAASADYFTFAVIGMCIWFHIFHPSFHKVTGYIIAQESRIARTFFEKSRFFRKKSGFSPLLSPKEHIAIRKNHVIIKIDRDRKNRSYYYQGG